MFPPKFLRGWNKNGCKDSLWNAEQLLVENSHRIVSYIVCGSGEISPQLFTPLNMTVFAMRLCNSFHWVKVYLTTPCSVLAFMTCLSSETINNMTQIRAWKSLVCRDFFLLFLGILQPSPCEHIWARLWDNERHVACHPTDSEPTTRLVSNAILTTQPQLSC